MALDDMYKEVILDHYKSPRNKRELPGAELKCTANNPLCGDEITVREARRYAPSHAHWTRPASRSA